MSTRSAIVRLQREVRAQAPAEPADPTPGPVGADGEQLAREVTRAFADELARYRRLRESEPARTNPLDPPDRGELDFIRSRPPDEARFRDIERLARADPAAATSYWEAVKAAARDDVDTGWLAARAVESMGTGAWERACFLAVRDGLRRTWQPRNNAEAMIVDEMAQYHVVRQWWVEVLAQRTRDPLVLINRRRDQGEKGEERYQTAVEATIEAGRMVERLQRLYQNAVRLLVSLRRGRSTVVFQRAGQVNVAAGPQLNVAVAVSGSGPDAGEPPAG